MNSVKSILKNPLVLGLVLSIAGFLVGRHFAPEKIIEKEKIVEKVVKEKEEIKSKDKIVTKKKHKIIVRVTRPDGTVEERIEEIESDEQVVNIDIKKTEKEENEKTVEKEKIIEKNKPQWHVSGLAGVDLSASSKSSLNFSSYGVSIERRIIGPFFAGLQGTNAPSVGVSVGFEF